MAKEPNHFVYEDDEFGTEGIEIIPPPEDPVAELDAEIARLDAILEAAGESVDLADAVLPLYISRKVLNAEEVLTWAREQGFENLLDPEELHVTQAYSRQPLEWFDVDQSWDEKIEVSAGGPRSIEMFGSAVVLRFANRSLQWRFEELRRLGASWDHADYKPHMTLSYDGIIPPGASPYQGRLELGPEIFEEIDDPSFFTDAEQPRAPAGTPTGGQWVKGSGGFQSKAKNPGGFGSGETGEIGFGVSDNPIPRSDLNVYEAVGKKRFTKKWDDAFKEEVIPVATLTTRQTLLDKAESNLRPVQDPSSLPPIRVARVNGINIILDGNHRAASLYLQGVPNIKASVIDLDDPKLASLINRDKL